MSRQHLADIIFDSGQTHADTIAIRAQVGGEWRPTPYRDMADLVRRIARALVAAGVQPDDRVAIFSDNRPEWAMVDFAILAVGGISVPIYATNTRQQAAYILDETEAAIVFTGSQANFDKVLVIAEQSPRLRCVIAFDDETILGGDKSQHFSRFLQQGAEETADGEIDARRLARGTGDLATIIYTSGTTGEPKGVMLTHGNLFHQFVALENHFHVGPGDRSICFLPLSHVYERAWSFYVYKCGATNYYLANPKTIIAAMAEVQPTVMVSVPRLYEKIYATAMHGLSQGSGLKRKLFQWSIDVGKRYQYALTGGQTPGPVLSAQHRVADRLVLSKVRAVVGGPKNFFSAGGAPLSKSIEEFFFAAGLLVCEGYGLTETSPMVTFNSPQAFRFGTVGKPIVGCEVKIAGNGEILVKSPSLTQGYYRKPQATAESFRDGWFHTGDVGEFDTDGFLRITDRIKDLIITSNGKNVAPQKVETTYAKDHFIEQFITLGDRRKFISALIVPNFEALEAHAVEQGITWTTREELVRNPAIHAFYQERINALAQELAPYEQVKAFTLLPAPFAQDTGELTPSLKIKRRVVAEKYSAEIEEMYSEQ